MGRPKSFFDNLYFGTGAEYLVMGDFIMRGYEAAKLSPDFGYDIHITNKHKALNDPQIKAIEYYLQVKARLIYPEGAEKKIFFSVEEENFHNMLSDNSSILVLVLLKGVKAMDSFSEDVMQSFDGNARTGNQFNLNRDEYQSFKLAEIIWLNTNDLNYLNNNKFITKSENNGINYIKILYDFGKQGLLDNMNEEHVLGESRKHLFCITDNYFGHEHSKLFL